MTSEVPQDMDALSVALANGRKRIRRRAVWAALILLLCVMLYSPLLGYSILQAADSGNDARVRFLLRIGAKPDSFGWYLPQDETPLMLAASNGSLATVQTLLDHGADVNTRVNGMDYTPLMCAVDSGNPSVVRLLIARGARLDTLDVWNDDAMYQAQASHHPMIVQLLTQAGASKQRQPSGEKRL